MSPRHGSPTQERAEALLLEHLTPQQRVEYEQRGAITVVKEGVIWKILLRHIFFLLLLVLPAIRIGSARALAGVLVTVAVALFPIWFPGFVVACSRRRTWRIEPSASPKLEVRGKQIDFCVRIDDALPGADRVLAYKNILEANESHFLRKANARF
jgi:hypothetical protein